MKHLIVCLLVALFSVMATAPAAAKNGTDLNLNSLPVNIIVKQTTTFDDGRTLTVFYKKTGSQCEVYSPCDVKTYNTADVKHIKQTNFEVVDRVQGKLYRKASLAEVRKVIKHLVNQYL